jgi:hypothetical protein
MLLSIISGSCQRIDLLQKMVASVRRYLHGGIAYEIIIVDWAKTCGDENRWKSII